MRNDIQIAPGTEAVLGTEVAEKPIRRRFTAEYKLGILKLADACKGYGELGALLRKEGLYSSNLSAWRRQRDKGTLSALKPKKRGRKAFEQAPLIREAEKLRKENERLKKRLKQTELIVDVQKKVLRMLETPLEPTEEGEND